MSAATLGPAGCVPNDRDTVKTLSQQVDALRVEKGTLSRRVAEQDAEISRLRTQVGNLLALGPGRLGALFVVERIALLPLTGGADYDGLAGDDGVTVYLQPQDASGHVLKAAGQIRIQLLDATSLDAPVLLGLYVIDDPQALRQAWYGDFWTDHYKIECPWTPEHGPPARREVTIRATFLDWLTGREFVAHTTVQIDPVPTAVR